MKLKLMKPANAQIIEALIRRLEAFLEKKLVESACGGDAESFRRLYELYYGKVVWLAYSIVLDRDRAEDIGQQCFAIACEKLVTLRDKGRFGAWICTICRNLSYKAIKSDRVKYVAIDEALLPFEEEGKESELVEEVQKAVFGLGSIYREVVVLFYYKGMSYDEIVDFLGVSMHTVKGRLCRARRKLEEKLKNSAFIQGI